MAQIGDKLGGIKEIVLFNKASHNGKTMEIKIESVDWLIEQAEKLKIMEKANYGSLDDMDVALRTVFGK